MRICSGAGCLRAVPDDVRFCSECRPQTTDDGIREHASGYTAELDALRKTTRWQRLRARVLAAQPMCARCRAHVADIVDHIVPAQIAVAQCQVAECFFDKWAGYFLRSNLQGLCRVCHAAKTLEDKTHSGPWPSVLQREQAQPKKVWTF
jgi:5-methylcytosine-specific restriction endonuclease McrA